MKVKGDPSRVGEVMVWRNFAPGDEFIPFRPRERKIGHSAAVKMAELDFADMKRASAKVVRALGHVRPTQDLLFNCFADFNICSHSFCLKVELFRGRSSCTSNGCADGATCALNRRTHLRRLLFGLRRVEKEFERVGILMLLHELEIDQPL